MAACRTYDPTKAPRRKASEYGARRGPGLFTELFTVRYTVVTIGSAPGYGHFGSPSSSTGPEGGGGARGEVLEWRKFSPVKTEVISKPLKDTLKSQPCGGMRTWPHAPCSVPWLRGTHEPALVKTLSHLRVGIPT